MVGYLFSFKGRLGRLGYFGLNILLGLLVFGLVLSVGSVALTLIRGGGGHLPPGPMLAAFVCLILIAWIGWAATARRIRDMGLPVALGLTVWVMISCAKVVVTLAAVRTPELAVLSILLTLVSGLGGLALTFWPSAAQAVTDGEAEKRFDEIFGEVTDLSAPTPALIEAAPRLLPERPAPQALRSAPTLAVRDASGRILPRAQFGLRQQGF